MRSPFYKKPHKAWYVKGPTGLVRLGADKQEALIKWAAMQKDTAFLLEGLIDQWLVSVKKTKAASTHRNYSRYAKEWKSVHGKLPATAIRGFHVNEFVERAFPVTDYSDSVRWQSQKVAVVSFAWAKDQGLLEVNHLADYRKNAKCGKRDTFLTQAQYDLILPACDPAFKDLLTVFWESGARPFEIFQAEAKHLKGKTLVFNKKAGDKVKSKDAQATRTIWLSDKAFAIVSRLAELYPAGVLFRNNFNQRWTNTACSRRLAALHRATGVKTTLYEFRHGFAYHHATVKGTNIVTLAALMGHSSIKMLAEVYAHVGKNSEFMLSAVN
jgi:integrase